MYRDTDDVSSMTGGLPMIIKNNKQDETNRTINTQVKSRRPEWRLFSQKIRDIIVLFTE